MSVCHFTLEYERQLRVSTQILNDMRRKQNAEWNRRQRTIDAFEARHEHVLQRLYCQIPQKSKGKERSSPGTQFEVRTLPSEPEIRKMVQSLDFYEKEKCRNQEQKSCDQQHTFHFEKCSTRRF